jgi:hypothetical protein
MRVVGYHCCGDEICNSDGEIEHSDYLGFLLAPKDAIKVFYNIDWAMARLCYLLNIPESQIKKLWSTGNLWTAGHTLFFVPHRYLSVKFGKHFGSADFSDIAQYMDVQDFKIDPLDAAQKARDVGQSVYDVLSRLNLSPKTLSSPISCYQKEILSTLDLPKPTDIPTDAQFYAHKCLHGGWQEAYKVGHFQAWDYDLTSAFTFHTANLIDTRFGTWFKSDKFYGPGKCPYGFCKGTVSVDKDFNSVIYTSDGFDYTPTGERKEYLTNAHVQSLYDHGMGRFKLESAWYWKPTTPLVYPLREHINRLFEWKQYLKGFDREIVKRMLVGLTGKLGETFPNGDVGKLHNLPWYSWVQDATKLQVADFVISNHAEDNLLSIAVDGCLFDREIPMKETGEMGTWRLNMSAPAFVVSSGVGAIKGKNGKGTFALNYDWLKSQIEADPGVAEYKMSKLTPITIGNALKNHKLEHLGELETTERSVILQEVKRFYPEFPAKGADLRNQYKSQPLDMSVLQAENYFTKVNEKNY